MTDKPMPPDEALFVAAQNEHELETKLCRALRARGIHYDRQVRTAFGRADVVTQDTVFEVKLHLTRSTVFAAVGQVTMYAAALNRTRSQKALIEALEERRTDIRQPDAATIVGLLRALKVSVNLQAEFSMDEHGNTTLKYSRDTSSPLKLPPVMTIGIPILKGHTAEDKSGKVGPVIYEMDVLIRVDQEGDGDKARVMFRLTIPNAEQALEDAVMDRVATAKALLGEELTILRSA